MCSPRVGDAPLNPWADAIKQVTIMAQTSIHFQPVKGGSEEHNKRTKKLDYVRSELSNNNDYWQSDTQSARLAFIADNAKAKTGRKMQAKATPIREAVVVIDDNTTMSDLHILAKRLRDRFGLDVFQIAIHRDEGHVKSDKIKLNLHAHLVADWTDHGTGKSLKLSRQDMSDMQTICAEVLHMERGRTSDKMHLSAIQYKIAAETKRAAEAEKKAREAEAKAIGSLVVGGANKLANALGFGKEAKALKDVPRQLAIAKEDGKTEAIAEVIKNAGIKYNDMSQVTAERVGRDTAALRRAAVAAAREQASETVKKLKIIQNMTEEITYAEAAKLLKEKYADMAYYKAPFGYAGNATGCDYKTKVFDTICEQQGAHKVPKTEYGIGRRELIAQAIIIAAIRYFDADKLDKLATTLKTMAQDFNLQQWIKRQQNDQPATPKKEQQEQQGRGWHL